MTCQMSCSAGLCSGADLAPRRVLGWEGPNNLCTNGIGCILHPGFAGRKKTPRGRGHLGRLLACCGGAIVVILVQSVSIPIAGVPSLVRTTVNPPALVSFPRPHSLDYGYISNAHAKGHESACDVTSCICDGGQARRDVS